MSLLGATGLRVAADEETALLLQRQWSVEVGGCPVSGGAIGEGERGKQGDREEHNEAHSGDGTFRRYHPQVTTATQPDLRQLRVDHTADFASPNDCSTPTAATPWGRPPTPRWSSCRRSAYAS